MPSRIARAAQRLPSPTPGLMATIVFLVSLAVFVCITPGFTNKVGWPTGDEPYYLLVAHSLIHDHDIDLTNQYDNQDYFHYYPGELYPRHESQTIYPGLYSKHGLGVALLIAPAYALGDWRGAAFFYNFLGALLAANIYLLAFEVSKKRWVALFLALTFCFSNPLLSYTFLIFPEFVCALLTIYAYRRIRLDQVAAPLSGNGVLRLAAISFCLGFMPWLHARYLPVSFMLFAYLVWREVRARRRKPAPEVQAADAAPLAQPVRRGRLLARLLALIVPAAICAVLFLIYFKVLYGTFVPNYSDHAGLGTPGDWIVAVFGSFLDQQWGLFIHAPVLILAITGIIVMVREHREELFWLAAISIPYALVIFTYKQWWGEWCPAARYWVSLVPLLAVPLGYLLAKPLRWGFWLLYVALAAIGWAIMAAFIHDPHLMYNHPVGSSHLLQWLAHGEALQPLLPTYFRAEWINVWLTVIYTELVLVIAWLGWKQIKKPA